MKPSLNEIPHLDARELKKFGLLLAGFLALVFGVLFSYFRDELLIWPWALSAGLAIWSFLDAGSLRPIYKGWMIFGTLVGHAISMVILFIIFFFLITPIGLITRFRQTAEPQSLWIDSSSQDNSDYEKPY